MKNIRTIALALIIALSCIVLPYNSVAASDGIVAIQPAWTNVDTVSTSLTFSGTTANCTSRIVGYSGTTKIAATITLEKKVNGSYTTVKTWTESSSSSTLNFSNTQSVSSGYTYRLTINATVTRNGVNETVSGWSEKSL